MRHYTEPRLSKWHRLALGIRASGLRFDENLFSYREIEHVIKVAGKRPYKTAPFVYYVNIRIMSHKKCAIISCAISQKIDKLRNLT